VQIWNRQTQEVLQLKTCPIWAALLTGVVLLQTVSPVLAASGIQQNNNSIGNISSSVSLPSREATDGLQNASEDAIPLVDLEEFLASVTNGEADQITGLYIQGFGGFNVIQPSAGNDGSVSSEEGVLTQYLRPASNRVIGLLAHNFASGRWFDQFQTGNTLYVLFGDGRQEIYRLTGKERFQALNGNSPTSNFIDLSTGLHRSAMQVYQQNYSGKPHLTLQTCIQNEDNKNWGRLFLLAELVE